MQEWISASGMKVMKNPYHTDVRIPPRFGTEAAKTAMRFHRQLDVYTETPLIRAEAIARKLGVKDVLIKDESHRFGLNAFKGLGGSYAMFRILCELAHLDPNRAKLEDLQTPSARKLIGDVEFVTCTDGNHGKGVSWAAALFGCKAHVYLPAGSREVRAEAIRNAGSADAVITDLNYDDTVLYARQMSEEHSWILIQDTAWPGYEQIPQWIIDGYLTMAYEISVQIKQLPTHVFLQAGVGAMAGGMLDCLRAYFHERPPVFVLVEPNAADCVYASILHGDGNAHMKPDCGETIMAGLNCGTPCALTWPIMRDGADFFVSCPDAVAELGMRYCAAITPKVIAGESGAAGIGASIVMLQDPAMADVRTELGITQDSVLLFVNTEGDTDPENYQKIVSEKTLL